MADTKISALTSGAPALGTDQIAIARSGANFKLTAADIAALVTVTKGDTGPQGVKGDTGDTGPQGAAGGSLTLGKPAYFFPSFNAFMSYTVSNVSPLAGGWAGVGSWFMFYLPFEITITRYRFQADNGTSDAAFYAAIYDITGALIFDIGAVAVSTAGQYGPGAAHDPGTVFFDASRNPTSSVHLTAGWYLYGWGATGTETGSNGSPYADLGIQLPGMVVDSLWAETVNVDADSLPSGIVMRWSHSGLNDISAGHMPLVLGRALGATTTAPPNICFFA